MTYRNLSLPMTFILCLLTNLMSCTNHSTDFVFDSHTDDSEDENRVLFTKIANDDWRLAENQDQITSNVWLTRADEGLLFNTKIEDKPNGVGPSGTKWFPGSLEDYSVEELRSLKFVSMKSAAGSRMREALGKTFIVHLVEDAAFIELTFRSWGNKSQGAGFSYSRTKIGG